MSKNDTFTVDLPSRGVPYNGALPEGKALLKPMGAAEEQILFQQGDAMSHIRQIIDNCYMDADKVPPEDLLVTDRMYILFMLRIQAFGPTYNGVPFRCSSCRAQRKISVNLLEDLDDQRMTDDQVEPFEVKLPHSGKKVQFRLLRGKDEIEVSRHAKRVLMRSNDAGDPSHRYRIGLQLVSIGGKTLDQAQVPEDKQAALEFAQGLNLGDAAAFRAAVADVEPGIDLTIMKECSKCGYINEFMMPFTAEFFQPSSR
jgi:hypothetical protein